LSNTSRAAFRILSGISVITHTSTRLEAATYVGTERPDFDQDARPLYFLDAFQQLDQADELPLFDPRRPGISRRPWSRISSKTPLDPGDCIVIDRHRKALTAEQAPRPVECADNAAQSRG
jgi:hypothetical protein